MTDSTADRWTTRTSRVAPEIATPRTSTRPIDFDAFFSAELPAMVALARAICRNHADAEEVAQEAFRRAHQHWDKVARYDRPGAWLRRVAINLALSRKRRAARELSFLSRRTRIEPVAGSDVERDDELWDAVRSLPPRQRAVIALFYQDDLSTREIADIMECSVSTTTSHLNRARTRLAELLGDRGGDRR